MSDTQYKIEELKYQDRLRGRCNACENTVQNNWESLIVVNEMYLRCERGTIVTRRHWACVTPRLLKSLMKKFPAAPDLDGFDCLSSSNQERVIKAWEYRSVSKRRQEDAAVLEDQKQREDQLRNVAKCFEDVMNC